LLRNALGGNKLFRFPCNLERFGASLNKGLHAAKEGRFTPFQIATVNFSQVNDLILRSHQAEPLLVSPRKSD